MKPAFNPFLIFGVLSFITATHSGAEDKIKANNTNALNLSTSWTSGVPGASDVAVWNNTVTAANSTVLGAPTTWQGIRVANPTGQVAIGGADTLTLGSGGIDLSATVTTTANFSTSAPVVFSTPQVWNATTSRTIAVSSAIDAGGNAFTKSGAGAAVWSSTTSNLPAVTVQGGVFRAGDGTGLPATTSLSLAGGAYEINTTPFVRPLGTGAGQVSLAAGALLASDTTGFSANGAAVTVNLGGASETLVWGSTPSFNPAVLVLNAYTANNALTFENPIDLNGANRTIASHGNTATISSIISGGAFGITKPGSGTLVLSGANTFSGTINITGGSLRGVDGTGIPSTAPLVLNGGVLESSGTLTRPLGQTGGAFRITGGSAGIGAQGTPLIVNIGGAGATLEWASTDFAPGTLVLQHYSANAQLTLENGIELGNAFRTLDVRADTAVVNGVISGTAGYTLNGSNSSTSSNSVLRLTNTNTYAGRTVIANNSGGRTRIAISRDENIGAVPESPFTDNIVMVNGGVLQADETMVLNPNRHIGLGSSGGGNNVTGTVSVQTGKHLTIGGSIANRTLNGFGDQIASPSNGSFQKIDPGILLLLNEESTYTGGTIINGGTLTITKLADGEYASSIGVSTNAAANLNLNGGRLQYYGDGDSTDRLFTISAANTTVDASGTAPLHFTNPNPLTTTGAGTRNLNVTGYSAGNSLASGLVDGPLVTVTATFTATANQITVPSTTGLASGQSVTGVGIAAGSVINSISGTTLTLSAATTGTAGTTTSAEFITRLSLVKTGSGDWTLNGTNTHTGITRIRGGGTLTLDYAGSEDAADPFGAATLIIEAGRLVFHGKSSGTTTENITTLQLGESNFSHSRVELQKGTGAGVQLSVGTLQGSSGSTQRHDLIDLSSGAGNSIHVAALGSSLKIENGVLMNNTAGYRASAILRDTDGHYGFATVTVPGNLTTATTTTIAPATGLASTDNKVNNRFTAGEYATTNAAYKFSTLTFDSSGGPIDFQLGNQFAPDGTGKGLLFSGTSDVKLRNAVTTASTNSALWFHNYLSDSAALDIDFNIGPAQVIMFGGSGFVDYSGTGFGTSFMTNGSLFRATAAQDIATPTGLAFRVTNGGVFEIGADLNGDTAGDLSNILGDNASGDTTSRFRLLGDSGLSAWTPDGGGFRTVNFGNGQALVWGVAAFMTNSQDSNYDGDYTLKLSSPRANATLDLKNDISFNNRQRVIEVASGVNDPLDTDAVLSGVLSGGGVGFTKTGPGILALTGVNTYTGETRVAAGILRLGSTSLASASRLTIDAGASVQVTGTLHVSALVIDGITQPEGPVNAPGYVTGNLIVGASDALPPYEQWALDKHLPAGKDGPNADADDDGIKNVIEYAVETDPLKSGDTVLTVSRGTTTTTLNYQYWQGKTDITVHLESTPDMVTWTPIVTSTNGGTPESTTSGVLLEGLSSGSPQNLVITDSRASTGKYFYRLRVVK